MPIISSDLDREALHLTFVAEFAAPPERVWQVWEDPRQLERWWGPPSYPATFDRHEVTPGGRSAYYMTSPEGEKMRGWWSITVVEPPRRFEFEDGFADENDEPTGELGSTRAVVTLEEADGRTRMTIDSTFENADQLEQMAEMGMEEGMREAIGQIDDLLSDRVQA
jgi:uncharacterized protein YndB with AHSA1/START domain